MTLNDLVVVFDLDGLLVDSQDIGRRAVNMALQELGCANLVTPEQWYEYFIMQGGSSGLTSRAYVAKILSTEDLRAFRTARDQAWRTLLEDGELPVYDDALKMSRWCKQHCKKVAIATNNDLSLLELILDRTEYGAIFEKNYVAAKALGIQKPDPRVLQETLNTIGEEKPGALVMIGDTLPDHELAVNFGKISQFPVRSIIRPDPYLGKFAPLPGLEMGADRVVPSLERVQPRDLLQIVRGREISYCP